MTYLEIDRAMYDIVMEKYTDCQLRLDAVPKENKSERKALIIEREMYNLCNRAGLLWGVIHGRDWVLTNHRHRVIGQILQRYPVLNEVFRKLKDEEQLRFIAALQAEIFMRDQIVKSYYAEYEAAKAAEDTKALFELRIKIGACENVFRAWEAWRAKHGIYARLLSEGLK